MPLYAYRCEVCGAEEEHLQKFSDPPKTDCERCGGTLSKLLTATAFHLKGGGWYKDGYASTKPEGAKGPAKDGNGGGGGDKGSSGAKSSTDKGSSGAKSSTDKGSSGAKSSTDKPSGTGGAKTGTG